MRSVRGARAGEGGPNCPRRAAALGATASVDDPISDPFQLCGTTIEGKYRIVSVVGDGASASCTAASTPASASPSPSSA
jgi:hypothetical protein